MRTNYVLIDYENVQPQALDRLDAESFTVFVFVGANQTKVNFDIVAAVQRMGANASYVKIAGNGKNALDFHIAFYIGEIAASQPNAYFHIISKDAGFDPLIKHLKARKILACRVREVADIPILKIANAKTLPEKQAAVVDNLRSRGASKPRTIKTLSTTIQSLFQQALSDDELASLLQGLEDKGIITLTGARIAYALPE